MQALPNTAELAVALAHCPAANTQENQMQRAKPLGLRTVVCIAVFENTQGFSFFLIHLSQI